MKMQIETITPERAAHLLSAAANNRTPRKSHVRRYAEDMAGGRWRLNGASIALSKSGQMVDGQHRLLACIEAKVPFETVVAYGLDPDAVQTIDTGKARTFGDFLAFKGETRYRNEKASAVRHIKAYLDGVSLVTASHISNGELAEFAEGLVWVTVCESIETAAIAKALVPTGPLAAVYYLTECHERIAEFNDGLATGAGLSIGAPALTLRNWVFTRRNENASLSQDIKFNAIISAWNAHASDRTLAAIHTKNRAAIK